MDSIHDPLTQAIIYRAEILERLELTIHQSERDNLVSVLTKLDTYILEQS